MSLSQGWALALASFPVARRHFTPCRSIHEGTTVVFQEDRGRLVLEPGNHAAIYALQGSLADFPLEQDLAEERQAEQKREDKR